MKHEFKLIVKSPSLDTKLLAHNIRAVIEEAMDDGLGAGDTAQDAELETLELVRSSPGD